MLGGRFMKSFIRLFFSRWMLRALSWILFASVLIGIAAAEGKISGCGKNKLCYLHGDCIVGGKADILELTLKPEYIKNHDCPFGITIKILDKINLEVEFWGEGKAGAKFELSTGGGRPYLCTDTVAEGKFRCTKIFEKRYFPPAIESSLDFGAGSYKIKSIVVNDFGHIDEPCPREYPAKFYDCERGLTCMKKGDIVVEEEPVLAISCKKLDGFRMQVHVNDNWEDIQTFTCKDKKWFAQMLNEAELPGEADQIRCVSGESTGGGGEDSGKSDASPYSMGAIIGCGIVVLIVVIVLIALIILLYKKLQTNERKDKYKKKLQEEHADMLRNEGVVLRQPDEAVVFQKNGEGRYSGTIDVWNRSPDALLMNIEGEDAYMFDFVLPEGRKIESNARFTVLATLKENEDPHSAKHLKLCHQQIVEQSSAARDVGHRILTNFPIARA